MKAQIPLSVFVLCASCTKPAADAPGDLVHEVSAVEQAASNEDPGFAPATGEGQTPDPGVQTNKLLPPNPPSSNQKTCSELSERAREEYMQLSSDGSSVPQCSDESDCKTIAFHSETDGCWASCGVDYGGPAYREFLRKRATVLCRDFRALDCPVLSAGCPAPAARVEPPSPRCVEGECQDIGERK